MPPIARALVALALVATAGCSADPADDPAQLCGDLGNLRATVEGLASPPEGERVGIIRGDLEKLDPTFGDVSRSGLVPEEILQPMLQAHVHYRDGIGFLGDDEPYLTVPGAVRVEAERLITAYRAVVRSLGCVA